MMASAHSEDPRLLSLADSIASGEPVDWDNRDVTTTATPDVLEELRVVDRLARMSAPVPDRWGSLSITGELGHGSQGTVYRAVDPNLGIELALKVVRPRDPADRALVANALNEARLLAQVNHPNVVRVFWAESIGSEFGVAMELVQGHTLSALIRRQGAFGARETMRIGVDVCRALAAVHGCGGLHGDIKAGNVMQAPGGRTVLMDFGVSQDLKTAHSAGLRTAGTPLYLAPELFAGHERSRQSDIYSVGVLLYHLATNAYPIDARDARDVQQHHAEHRPRRLLRDVRPDLPDGFVQTVERATAERPDDRYHTAGELEAALNDALGAPVPRPRWALLMAAAAVVLVALLVYVKWPNRSVEVAGPVSASERRATAPASSSGPSSVADTYRIDAAFYRRQNGSDIRLQAGARVTPGDYLSLRIQSSVPVHAYVVNEDDHGESYLLFPLPNQQLANPLPAGTRHEMPGLVNGTSVYWQVSSAGGREHFLIFVTPHAPSPAFERMFASLPRPAEGVAVTAQRLSTELVGALRGVGGLIKAPPSPARERLADEFAVPLSDAEETARGVWVRQLTLENPVK